MNTKEKILRLILGKNPVSGTEIAAHFNISKQAVNKHIKALIQEQKIVKQGVTRGAAYIPAGKTTPAPSLPRINDKVDLKGLEEHEVFNNIDLKTNLRNLMSEQAFTIVRYAFTEILNNAIDHSCSHTCTVQLDLDQYDARFIIRDSGIGIFHSIMSKFGLKDEQQALGELLKGKKTTMAELHSGEGVFFSSKSADTVSFRSHNIDLVFDNLKNDILVGKKRFIKGTEVRFSISRNSRRDLSTIFSQYSPEEYDYRFERTKAMVNLLAGDYVSRSEAKRLLAGLDNFKDIILDFNKVSSIGQGFADEIFRVFQNDHPDIRISTENANPVIQQMINHVVDNR
ncbi:MAG TPA: DUF4325 domain-containing protein [Deltaproteobacteria bacterium]|nr:DUF4325 domain-containing protein [Deltaproteobacteria bacterium]